MALPITQITKSFDNKTASTFDVTISDNKFELSTIKIADDGTKIFSKEGYIEFPAIDLGQFYMNIKKADYIGTVPTGASIEIYTSTSQDAFNFSPFVKVNPDYTINSPQGRYIKVRMKFFGKQGIKEYTASDFLAAESMNYTAKVDTIFDGDLSIKKTYNDAMIRSGKVYSATIKKSKFKKLNSLELR